VSLSDIRESIDAREWASEYVKVCRQLGKPIDENTEGWMIGWFANAMMAVSDHKEREYHGNCDLIMSNYDVYTAQLERLTALLHKIHAWDHRPDGWRKEIEALVGQPPGPCPECDGDPVPNRPYLCNCKPKEKRHG